MSAHIAMSAKTKAKKLARAEVDLQITHAASPLYRRSEAANPGVIADPGRRNLG